LYAKVTLRIKAFFEGCLTKPVPFYWPIFLHTLIVLHERDPYGLLSESAVPVLSLSQLIVYLPKHAQLRAITSTDEYQSAMPIQLIPNDSRKKSIRNIKRNSRSTTAASLNRNRNKHPKKLLRSPIVRTSHTRSAPNCVGCGLRRTFFPREIPR
jgi:hypothetical protein